MSGLIKFSFCYVILILSIIAVTVWDTITNTPIQSGVHYRHDAVSGACVMVIGTIVFWKELKEVFKGE